MLAPFVAESNQTDAHGTRQYTDTPTGDTMPVPVLRAPRWALRVWRLADEIVTKEADQDSRQDAKTHRRDR
jgi:hypothetical protein